ncbi:MAG TPA: sulfur carrier protein ThiS [Tepidiformaceae bacterium]
MITVRINGETRALPAGTDIPGLIREVAGTDPEQGIAIALNGEVIRRVDWPAATLHNNDIIEIVRATQGG